MPNDTNEDGAEGTLDEQQRTCYMTQRRTWQNIKILIVLLEDNGLKCLPWQSDRGNDGEENYRLLYI